MIKQREGIVQLGDLTAPATWANGQILSIRFFTGTFSAEQWQATEHLRYCPHPVSLVCAGTPHHHRRIVGHERDSSSVTFHVSQD